MKNIFYLLGIGCLLLVVSGAALAEVPPPAAAAAAEKGLARYLREIPPAELVKLGFPDGDTSGADAGDPWQVYTITPDNLLSASSESSVESLITATGLWYFPVYCNGEARTILTVALMDGEWEAVAIGKAPLARQLDKILRQWPRTGGYNPKLIAVYQAGAYFFNLPEKDRQNFTPLIFNGVGFDGYRQESGPAYSTTTELENLIGPLQDSVRRNLKGFQSAGPGEEE